MYRRGNPADSGASWVVWGEARTSDSAAYARMQPLCVWYLEARRRCLEYRAYGISRLRGAFFDSGQVDRRWHPPCGMVFMTEVLMVRSSLNSSTLTRTRGTCEMPRAGALIRSRLVLVPLTLIRDSSGRPRILKADRLVQLRHALQHGLDVLHKRAQLLMQLFVRTDAILATTEVRATSDNIPVGDVACG